MNTTQTRVSPVFRVYEYNHFSFHRNLDDISHQQSIIRPPSYANTINWIAGHIVQNRDTVLKMLGQDPICDEGFNEVYKRGTKIFNDVDAFDLEYIIEIFDRQHEIINAAFQELDYRRSDHHEILNDLAGFAFHEAYHIGQLGTGRRLVGKKGALK